jgi:glutathione S-transferase
VNGAAYPKLQAFVDKMLSRPSFARALAHEAKILAG